MIRSTGTVLLNVAPERSHVPEYLAHSHHQILVLDWTGVIQTPDILVTDVSWSDIPTGEVAAGIECGRIGVIGLGIEDDVDVLLPTDAQGREVATAIDLVWQIVALRRQHTQDQRECQRWIDLAHVDPLTGLPNRRAWERELAQRSGQNLPLCLGLIDVDFFKRINDDKGHDVGDLVLREVAMSLRSNLREADFVARLGGDEFGVLLSGATTPVAEQVVERVRGSAARYLADRDLPRVTLSAGFAVSASDACDGHAMYSFAARSLQTAKRRSRDCSVATFVDWSSQSASR